MRYLIEFYYPIVHDWKFEKYPFEQKGLIIKEIAEVLEIKPFEVEPYILGYQIEIEVEGFDQTMLFEQSYLTKELKESNLKFGISVEADIDKLECDESESITKEYFLVYNLVHFFSNNIFELLVISQIARPGSLKLRRGICYSNGVRFDFDLSKVSNFREQMELRDRINYPEIQFMNFFKFYNWLKDNNSLFPAAAINGIQRALNNLTYVHTEKNEISEFIFELRILEDLYTVGNNQVTEQLNCNIQLFLGELNAFKKKIKHMYAVRSDFIHGRMSLEPSHKIDEINYMESDAVKISDASFFSLLLIVGTIQKMYRLKLFNLEFQTTLKLPEYD